MMGGNCVTCKFYSKGSHYDCRENIDELVTDKERPNFCEYYQKDERKAAEFEQQKQKRQASAEDLFNSFFSI